MLAAAQQQCYWQVQLTGSCGKLYGTTDLKVLLTQKNGSKQLLVLHLINLCTGLSQHSAEAEAASLTQNHTFKSFQNVYIGSNKDSLQEVHLLQV